MKILAFIVLPLSFPEEDSRRIGVGMNEMGSSSEKDNESIRNANIFNFGLNGHPILDLFSGHELEDDRPQHNFVWGFRI